jgi:hypothetical protein
MPKSDMSRKLDWYCSLDSASAGWCCLVQVTLVAVLKVHTPK